MKPSVLHIANHFFPCIGGIETHVEKLCLSLAESGLHTEVACLDRCANAGRKLESEETINGIRTHRLPFIDFKYYKPAFSIRKLLKNFDMLHVHGIGFFSDFCSLSQPWHKKPMVLTTHGGIFHTASMAIPKKIYFGAIERALIGKYKKVIAVSRNDKKTFSRICKPVYIPNGIDFSTLSGIKRKPKENTFLYIGRISRNKRIDRLIGFINNIAGAKLYIAGADFEGLCGELMEKSKKLGVDDRVEFLGEISEKKKLGLLGKAEFFVSASQYEGFGISALEAMAAGCTPILQDIPAFRELAANGRGHLVNFDKPPSESFLRDMKTESRCRQFAREFDWKQIAQKTRAAYEAM